MVAARTRFGLLGEVEAFIGGQLVGVGHARQRCVLVALLVDANRVVPIDELVDRVWADRAPHRSREALYTYLSRLRRVLTGADDVRVTRHSGGYQLAVDPMMIDLHRFRSLVGQARLARDDDVKAAMFEQALGLWRGPAFPTLDTPWLNGVRDALDRERVATELDCNDLVLHRGRHTELLADLATAAAGRPLDERLTGQLMLALYRCGRQADALEQHRQLRVRLAEELGVDPGPALQRLHQQILTADSALEAPAAAAAPPVGAAVPAVVDSRGPDARFAGSRAAPREPGNGPVGSVIESEREGAARLPADRPQVQVCTIPVRNPHFTGRNSMLDELHRRFGSDPGGPAVYTLCGLGGVGKTELAIEYAHRFGGDYEIICWIDAEDAALIPDQLCRLAGRLGLPDQGTPADVVDRLLADLAARPGGWLIIFDNADRPEDIASYRPSGTGHILVTSRSPGWRAVDGRVEVDVLDRAETVSLLQRRVPAMTTDLADQMAAELGDLPLAAARVAAHLEQGGGSAADYLRRFRSLRGELGVAPGQRWQELHRMILAADPSLQLPSAVNFDPAPRVAVEVHPAPRVWNVPARNPRFTGRVGMLQELRDRLRGGDSALVVQTLFGLGGVGKTQTAIEYAHRYAADYDVVWWIDAERPALIPGQLTVLADRLGLPSRGAVAGTVERLLTELTRRPRWLLIFDNAEHPDDIATYRPAGSGQIMVTSRYPGWGALGGRVEVDVLARAETTSLLRAWIPPMTAQEAEKLAAELGDLPLAAAQAAAYLEQTGSSAADYLRRFGDQRAVLLARGEVLGYQGRVDTAWLLALDRLRVDNPAAVTLLEFAAFLAPEPIPVGLFTDHPELLDPALRDPDAVADAVGAAVSYSLIRRSGDDFQVHRLVQAVIRDRLPPARRDAVPARVLALLAAACPGESNDPSNWPAYRRLTPHLLAIGALAHQHPEGRRLMLATVGYLGNRGDTRASRRIGEEIHRRWQRQLGEDHPDTLTAAAALTAALTMRGQGEQGCALGEDALRRSRRVLGPDHPVTLRLAASLTHALTWRGPSRQACTLGEDTLHRSRLVLGPVAPDTLRLATHLVVALALQGRTAEARTLGEDTVRRSREAFGPHHPLTVFCVSGLALAGVWLGDQEAIGVVGEDTLQRCSEAIGPDHPTTLGLAGYLTIILRSRGQIQQARTLAEDTLRRSREAHGPDHLAAINSGAVLAVALVVAGEAERARMLGEDTLQRSRTAFGPDNPITLVCAAALTAALAKLGQTVRARTLAEDTLHRSRTALGPDHTVTLAVTQTLDTLTHGTALDGQRVRSA